MPATTERNPSAPAPAADEARTISGTRLFDAPRELVFRMWTDREHIANWFGPRGFTITTQEMDVRPGGRWRFIMHGPDGTDYPNEIVYREVDPPSRLVYRHGPGPLFDVTVTFEEENGKTRLTMRSVFESAEVRDKVAEERGAVEGLHETLDRLVEEVAMAAPFTITRTFDAPRDLVFRVWTERDHLVKWWGPKGFDVFHCTADLRPGGVMHYGLRGPNDMEMWGRWVFREITPPRRLVFVSSFSDAQGNVTRAPFFDDWPLETLSVVTFTEHEGRTTVTMQAAPIGATEAERARFESMHGSMQQGWTGTFDQLSAYLAEQRS